MIGDEEGEKDALCIRCRVNVIPLNSVSVICEPCRYVVAPQSVAAEAIEAIRGRQAVFTSIVDDLIGIYRDFDRTRRPILKTRMKAMYEKIQELGSKIGISRSSLDHLWKG